jgi:3-oxoacyl-[acyl-carrier protein] reductase
MNTLEGKVAIVTGAARGIGLASSQQFADAGAAVVMADLDGDTLAEAAETVKSDTALCVGDICEPGAADDLVSTALERFGKIDIVFNNAGYNWDAPLIDLSDEQVQAMLDVHVLAPFRILRAVGPHFRDQAAKDEANGEEVFRKVINTSSVAGTMGNPNQANYNAGKAAIVGLTKGLAKEWGPWRVNVNAIAPGLIDTRLTASPGSAGEIAVAGHAIPLGISADRRQQGTDLVPLGRPGRPDEVASAVLFLASAASDYVTGQTLSVTGGVMLGMAS